MTHSPRTSVHLPHFPKNAGYKGYDFLNIAFDFCAEMHSSRNLIKVVSDIP